MIDRVRKISHVVFVVSLCLLNLVALFYFEIIPFIPDDAYQAAKATIHSHPAVGFGFVCGFAILAAFSSVILWFLKDKSAEFHYEQLLKSSQKTTQAIEAKQAALSGRTQEIEKAIAVEKAIRSEKFGNHLANMMRCEDKLTYTFERIQSKYQSATIDIQSAVKATLPPEQSNHDVFVQWDNLHPPSKRVSHIQ